MGQKSKHTLGVQPQGRSGRSPARSPKKAGNLESYASEGVKDYDILNLPASDYQLLGLVTFIAAVVRLFRIYQPTSVVFDEVQYVPVPSLPAYLTIEKWHVANDLCVEQLWWFCVQIYQGKILHGCSPAACQTPDHAGWLAGWL